MTFRSIDTFFCDFTIKLWLTLVTKQLILYVLWTSSIIGTVTYSIREHAKANIGPHVLLYICGHDIQCYPSTSVGHTLVRFLVQAHILQSTRYRMILHLQVYIQSRSLFYSNSHLTACNGRNHSFKDCLADISDADLKQITCKTYIVAKLQNISALC